LNVPRDTTKSELPAVGYRNKRDELTVVSQNEATGSRSW